MYTAEYPEIGKSVKYLRADDKGNIFRGFGIVRAIFLDPNDRVQVQVRDGDNAWNIDFFCINPTDETLQEYQEMIADVQRLTDEGNALVKEIVEKYNDLVKQAYDVIIGEPVEVLSINEVSTEDLEAS
jgi:mevalonate kinase